MRVDNKNIAFVGFMASGKSSVSKELSLALDKEMVSSDDLIVEKEGRSIKDIFERSGEEYFRKLEVDVIQEVSKKENVIIDCGGGVVMNPVNVENLKKNGVLVYLSISPELVYARIKGTKDRPLLNVEDPVAKIKELLEHRRPFYEKADFIIKVDNKVIGEVCQEILELLNYE
ncbi:MAG: shikimate kinase [Candidatus Omnitrophica bacterium]|nr:shikimate kinase [Candidatus Omnitrophota bacterium]MBU4333550.1 shikimate kinase [Candidatus Omnitrophota bacterium]